MGDHARGPSAIEAVLRPYVPDLLRSWPEDCAWLELDGTMVSADITGFTALTERLAERDGKAPNRPTPSSPVASRG